MRNRLVTITADLSTDGVTDYAVLWLRVDGPGDARTFKNSSDQEMSGTAPSRSISITLRVNSSAVAIYYGMVMSGAGKAEARHLRVTSKPAPTGPPSAAAGQLLDSVYAAVREGSYWRDTVSWSVVEPQYRAMAEGAQTTDEAYDAIRWLLSRLGDHHSNVMSPAMMRAMNASGSEAGAHARSALPEVKSLDGGFGYVMVPAFGSIDSSTGATFAADIRAGLGQIALATRCGWVVDLRLNGGGNMWPMLAGLQPFLGNGPLGYFQGADSVNGMPWRAGLGYAPSPASLASLDTAPVAVLTGPLTGSSGEAVTIAFRGRPRTRSFGLPTAGLANANMSALLPDGGMLSLMNAVDVDRDGHVYGYKVDPDVKVPDGDPGTDAALDLAISWLKAESKCK
jgi:C-terminal processing protease CtpA/Prc